jgi:type II secretion system protein H
MTTSSAAQPAARAFTLMELMVVLAVIAIMSALILPEMRGTFDDALLRSDARKLIGACQVANSRAITLNQVQRLRLETRSGRFVLEKPAPSDDAFDPTASGKRMEPVEGQIDSRLTMELLPEGTEPESAEAKPDEASRPESPPNERVSMTDVIRFNPDGTVTGPQILLRDRAGFRLALRFHPVTGRVRVDELARR